MKREGKQSRISPVTLVIAGVGLAVAGFLWIAPPFKTPQTPGEIIPPRQSPPVLEVPEEEAAIVLNPASKNDRNPFQAPPLVNSLREPPASGGVQKPLPTVAPGPVKSVLPEVLPVWQGLLRTKKDQLVIVRYAAKTHFLRRGDLLPESSYRLTEIGPDYIIFNSPNKQLELARERKGK